MLTLFCRHSSFVAHLLDEIADLQRQRDHERRRAESAIDRLLIQRQIGPVTPVELGEPTEQEKELAALLKNPEWTTAGSAE